MAFKRYSYNIKKSYRMDFEKSSLYFTSPMKISKSKCNRKKPKILFNFDSIKNSFWVHIDTGIRMLFKKFLRKVIE